MVLNIILAVKRQLETLEMAMLWLTAYTWLLRLPSEVRCGLAKLCYHRYMCVSPFFSNQALPLCVGSPEMFGAESKQTLVWRDGEVVCLRMLRRKNRPHGSGVLRRVCTCSGSSHMCVVHTLWDQFLGLLPEGTRPWHDVAPGEALFRLRRVLARLGVPNAKGYRTQDLRRGHAEDMRQSGSPLADILRAGQWRSAAFMKYLDEACFSCSPPWGHIRVAWRARQTWKRIWPTL